MKVFISWSGARSKALALSLRELLPLVLDYVEPWVSEIDISAGDRWSTAIAEGLQSSQAGIICLTRDNMSAPWLLFESGAIAKDLDNGRIIPILLDVEPKDIVGPLAQFQLKKVDRNGIGAAVASINRVAGSPISPSVVEERVARLWAGFSKQLKKALDKLPPDIRTTPVADSSSLQGGLTEYYADYPRDRMVSTLSQARHEIWIFQTWFSNWFPMCEAFRVALHRARESRITDKPPFRIRIILSDPKSAVFKMRSVHSGRPARNSAFQAQATLAELAKFKHDERCTDEEFQVRLSSEYATFALFAADDTVYFNPYLRERITYESPCFRFEDGSVSFGRELRRHFETLWSALDASTI